MEIKFDKDMSIKIKAFALILMIIHHFFGFPNWYVKGIDYSNIIIFGQGIDCWVKFSTKICVSLFAFTTGWAYFFNKNKTMKYSIKKIVSFLIKYWIILFFIFIPFIYFMSGNVISIKVLILNMFALKDPLIIKFAWYVYFYIFAMLVLPIVVKAMNGGLFIEIIISIGCCVISNHILSYIQIVRKYLISDLRLCFFYLQCVLIGYIFAKYDIFNRMKKVMCIKNVVINSIIIFVILYCRLKWRKILGINLDIVYAPVVIFEFIKIFCNCNSKIFKVLGENSLNVWFIHSIFFSNYTKQYTQKILYYPQNPILVILWGIIICTIMSIILNYIIEHCNKTINNLGEKVYLKICEFI